MTQYFLSLAAAAAAPLAGVGALGWSPWTLLALAGLLPCVPAARRVIAVLADGANGGPVDRRTLNPALGMTARGVAFFGAGLGVGAALAGFLAGGS